MLRQCLHQLRIGAVLLLIVLEGAGSHAIVPEFEPSLILHGKLSGSLTCQLSFASTICLVLFVGLSVLKLIAFLQVLNHSIAILTGSSRDMSHSPHLLHVSLSLDDLAGFAPRNEINRVVLELVLRWHIRVLNHSFLRTGLGFFNFFSALLGFDWRIVNLRLLATGPVHAVEHLAHFIMTAEVLVQVSVVDGRRFHAIAHTGSTSLTCRA